MKPGTRQYQQYLRKRHSSRKGTRKGVMPVHLPAPPRLDNKQQYSGHCGQGGRAQGQEAYWCSTPQWTCLVVIDAQKHIVDAAPLLRRFVGQPASNLRRWTQAKGWQMEVVQLPQGQEPPHA